MRHPATVAAPMIAAAVTACLAGLAASAQPAKSAALPVADSTIDPATLIERDPAPRWFRGNLHTHTLWSDGDDFPEMIAEWYLTHGYHFLALSDHNVLSRGQRWMSIAKINERAGADAFAKYLNRFGPRWVEARGDADTREVRLKPIDEYRSLFEQRGRFLLIESEEITSTAGNGRAIHMNAANLAELIQPPPTDDPNQTVRDVMAANIDALSEQAQRLGREVMIHVNHPNYKWGVTAEDLAHVVQEPFFEVWNGVDGDNDPGDGNRPSTDEIWDIATTLRLVTLNAPPIMGLATDDSHDYHGTRPRALPGRAWIMVRATHLTPEHIVRAIHAGDFYATTGVTLSTVDFDPASRRLTVTIDPVPGETYTTRFIGSRRGVNVTGTPRRDQDGNLLDTTLDYTKPGTPGIGEVFATATGATVSYTMTDDDLYVRAVITSSAPNDVPQREIELKTAWTQPVGWTLAPANGR